MKSGTEVDEKTNSLKEMCLDHDNREKRELGGKKNEFLSVNLNSWTEHSSIIQDTQLFLLYNDILQAIQKPFGVFWLDWTQSINRKSKQDIMHNTSVYI